MTLQERFEAFDKAHPDVYTLFERFAFELIAAGRTHYGAKGLIERIRWHFATSTDGKQHWKINNVFTSRYARKFAQRHPDHATFFETRILKSA